MHLNEVKVVIYSDKEEKGSEETLSGLYNFINNLNPYRILIALEQHNDKVLSFLHQKFPAIPIEYVHCRVSGIKKQ